MGCTLCSANIERRMLAEGIAKTAVSRLEEAERKIIELKGAIEALEAHSVLPLDVEQANVH